MGSGKPDHIRLPIDEEQMWNGVGDKQTEAFDLLDAALDWCEAAGLRVIVDQNGNPTAVADVLLGD